MYAIVKTGGKQYRVQAGDTITIEKLSSEVGSEVAFEEVLLIGQEGRSIVGKPIVAGASVTGVVQEHGRGRKIVVFTYKPKKNIRKKKGHRQPFTKVLIENIVMPDHV